MQRLDTEQSRPREAKFRRLDLQELKQLELEFVQFLASQSISAEDWTHLKANKPQRAEDLVVIFSDVVMEKVLSKIKLLERRSRHELHLYQCKEDKITWVGIQITNESPLDLSGDDIQKELELIFGEQSHQAQLLRAEKTCGRHYTMEIFKLTQSGCLISQNEELFEMLSKMTCEQTE